MKTTFAVLAVCAVSAVATPVIKRQAASATIDDTTILNFALTLEHLENAFYKEALAKFDEQAFLDAGLPPWARGRYAQQAQHEVTHVAFLEAALGANATQPCTYNFPFTDPKSFAALSQILETVGVSAYSGAAQLITNKDYLTAAAVILSTEARHAAWINSAVQKFSPWSGPFDIPLDLNEVFSLAAPMIVSCPSTNPVLPVKAFPNITITPAAPNPGDTVAIQATGASDSDFAVFLSGLNKTAVPISGGKVAIPSDLLGSVFMVISSTEDVSQPTDVIAGPALFQFEFDSNGQFVENAPA